MNKSELEFILKSIEDTYRELEELEDQLEWFVSQTADNLSEAARVVKGTLDNATKN